MLRGKWGGTTKVYGWGDCEGIWNDAAVETRSEG